MNERPSIPLQVTRLSGDHVYIVASIREISDVGAVAKAIYEQIADALTDSDLAIFHERVFGSLPACKEALSVRSSVFQGKKIPHDNPITCIQGLPAWENGLAGVIIHAVSIKDNQSGIQTIFDERGPCGREWTKDSVKYLLIQSMQGIEPTSSSPDIQAGSAIEEAEKILFSRSSSYSDVVRTWFYLEDILDWYDDFNIARSIRYRKFGIMPGPENKSLLLPSSTGISGNNPQGSACCMNLLAISGPMEKRPQVVQLSNTGQADAFSYGSAFSRGALIQLQDVSLLQISGTAAINEKGESLFPGEIQAQIQPGDPGNPT